MEFVLLQWSAYAHGLSEQAAWLEWARSAPQLPAPAVDIIPPLTEMPALMRRRVDRLGRLACQVAYWCDAPGDDTAMVFASRYGDSARSLSLLGDLVKAEPVSPAGFGLSVHNAVSALYSIATKHTGNTVVVAAGKATAAAALAEAAALLDDGAPEVLVVYYEAPLPGGYAQFEDEACCEYAWCWRLALPNSPVARDKSQVRIRLEVGQPESTHDGADSPQHWPAGLSVLRHVLKQIANDDEHESGMHTLIRNDRQQTQWSWSAHA